MERESVLEGTTDMNNKSIIRRFWNWVTGWWWILSRRGVSVAPAERDPIELPARLAGSFLMMAKAAGFRPERLIDEAFARFLLEVGFIEKPATPLIPLLYIRMRIRLAPLRRRAARCAAVQ